MSTLHNKTAQATSIYFDVERIHVCLSDGREISAPLKWFPRLLNATDGQRRQWELIGRDVGIHWEAIDEDISVAGLLGLPNDESACYLPIADHISSGIFQGEGAASNAVSFGKSLRAILPWVTNQGGVGMLRKGPRKTDFCGRENIKELCTTLVPD